MFPVHQVWPKPFCKAQWKGEEDKADRERQHQGMDRPGVRQVPEGSWEQGKMEKTGCKIICGAPTTLAVKGLMMMMMMTSGLEKTFKLSPSYSFHKSLYHRSLFSNHNSNSIHNFGTQTQKNNNTCFGTYLYSVGTQHRKLHQAQWPILCCGPTQEPVLAPANTGKTQEMLWKKMQVNGHEG